MSGIKQTSRRIVSILNGEQVDHPPHQSPQQGSSKSKQYKQPYCDVRSIELQELEDYSKVMNEVKKRLNMDHIKKLPQRQISNATQSGFIEFYDEIEKFNYKIPKIQNMKQFNIKEQYYLKNKQKQLDLQKQKELSKTTKSYNSTTRQSSQHQSRIDLEINQYIKDKQQNSYIQPLYKDHINQSQRNAFIAKNNTKQFRQSVYKEDNVFQRQQIISMVTGLPKKPYTTLSRYKDKNGQIIQKEYLECNQSENIVQELQEQFDLRDGNLPLELKRQQANNYRGHSKQYSHNSKKKSYESLVHKVETNESKLLNEFREFFQTKSSANDKFNNLITTLYKDRPLISSIRQRSYSLKTQSKSKIQNLRCAAEQMRKTFMLRNKEQRDWYEQLVKDCPKYLGKTCEFILDSLRLLLEDGQYIKIDDILDLIDQIEYEDSYQISFLSCKLIHQIFEYFKIEIQQLQNFPKFKQSVTQYLDHINQVIK